MSLLNLDKTYAVIHADPPWYFKNYSKKGEDRNAVSHYDCMDLEQIKSLPVNEIAQKNAILFLWVTDPFLAKGLDVVESWGFEYKTVGFYWAKTNKKADLSSFNETDFFCGLGYWTRANVEQCLLATKGSPKRKARDVRRLIVDPRREHSRKPGKVFDRIERLVEGPYLDLFSRESRNGWDAWGNERQLFDAGVINTRSMKSQKTLGEVKGNLKKTRS